jgi:cytochrome c oxidase assembly factor CtaG
MQQHSDQYTGDIQTPSEDQRSMFGLHRWTGPTIEDALGQARQQLRAEQERSRHEQERSASALEAVFNQCHAVERQMKEQLADLTKERYVF